MRPRAVSGAREVGDSRRPRATPEHEAGHRPLHGAFCVPVGGEAPNKGGRPSASPVLSARCLGPGHGAARPWIAAAGEAVPALLLRLCEQSLVSGPPAHTFRFPPPGLPGSH